MPGSPCQTEVFVLCVFDFLLPCCWSGVPDHTLTLCLSPRSSPSLLLSPAMLSTTRSSLVRTARTHLLQSRHTTLPQSSAFTRFASTLALLEQKDGKLNPSSLSAITAGTKLGGSITAFIAGSGVKAIADEAAKAKGVEKIIYVDNAAYDKVSTLAE